MVHRRARLAGARMSDKLVVGISTHVIAARNLNAEEIARKLGEVPQHAAGTCYEVHSAISAHSLQAWCLSALLPWLSRWMPGLIFPMRSPVAVAVVCADHLRRKQGAQTSQESPLRDT